MMNRFAWIAVSCLLCSANVSCKPSTRYVLYNDTNTDIVMSLGLRTYRIAEGDYERIRHAWLEDGFSIETKSQKWIYTVHLPQYHELTMNGRSDGQGNFYSDAGFAAKKIWLRVDGEGKILLMKDNASVHDKSVEQQPDGFPLLPTTRQSLPTKD